MSKLNNPNMDGLASSRKRMVAMIPARIGSTRLAMKNLALLDGKPLIYYAIAAAKDSGIFDEIIVNSESSVFKEIAGRYEVGFYERPARLATLAARSDAVVYDFIENNRCDIVVWVNPISPLQDGSEIRNVVKHFLEKKLDSLITVKSEQVHCLYRGRPVNFEVREKFARTQDLDPVYPFVYSLMMWRSKAFIEMYEKKGYALFCGKFGTYPASRDSAVIIKREEDLALADHMMVSRKNRKRFKLKYDRVVAKSRDKKP